MKKHGFILLIILPLILLMCITSAIFFVYQNSSIYTTRREVASEKAFWLSDAGVSRAVYEMRKDIGWGGMSSTSLGAEGGTYSVSSPEVIDATSWKIISTGKITSGLSIGDVERKIEAIIVSPLPSNFFGNAIYAPEVELKGSYEVNGDIVYSDELELKGSGTFVGTSTQDPSVNPLARLNFQQLKDIALSQIKGDGTDNFYSASELSNPDFPLTFWFDEVNSIPNVVYVEGDLALNGNIGTIGGFFVVVGNVLTDPSSTGDTSINGNGAIEGCVYTTGDFNINGGAQKLNINGGVWAGNEADLNGNAKVDYNATYQDAIRNLNITFLPEVERWKEVP